MRVFTVIVASMVVAGLGTVAPPASADPGPPPALLATLGGPGHAEMYASGLEYSSFDDTLVVADTGNHRIKKYDPVTGELIWSVGGYGTAGSFFNDPRDVGVDSAGNVYVADTGNIRIVKLDPAGNFVTSWKGPVGDTVGSPIGITVSAVGGTDRVYIADALRLRVRVWNTALTAQTQAFGGSGSCTFSNIRDVDAADDGTVYVANYLRNDILKMSPSGACLGQWGAKGSGDGEFKNPYGVRVVTDPIAGEELVYVADSNNNRIQVFDLDGNFVAKWGAFGDYNAAGTFSALRRVAVDDEGGLWGADLWGWSVEHAVRGPGAVPSYAFDHSIPSAPSQPPFTDTSVFNEVRQVAFDGPDLLAMDTVNQRIVHMDATTGVLDGPACGKRGWENGAFNWPRGVAVDPATGQLWVADTKQSQLQILGPNCSFLAKLPPTTTVPAEQKFNYPYNIAIRASDGTAWVTDAKNHRLKVYDVASRSLLAVYGGKGTGTGQFQLPQGITIDADGHIWVADTNNNRVVELSATAHAGNINWMRSITSGFNRPGGVAVDTSGRIYVADSLNNRMVILNADTSLYASVTDGYRKPESVALDPTGKIFLSDTYNDRILVYEALPGGAGGTLTYVDDLVGPGVADMYPVDVADFGNHYYVMDPGRYSVFRVNRTTGLVDGSVGGHQGRAPGELGAARAIATDSAGRVYVADTPNNRVDRFSTDLAFEMSWGSTGTGPGQFSQVYGVAVGQGKLAGGTHGEVVYTTDGGRVQKFTTDGVFISQFGQGRLTRPRQLSVDPVTHNLYVVSAGSQQVVVFDQDGNELFRFGGEGTGNGKFEGDIRGIDITDTGLVFVSDDGNHRVQVFNQSGAYLYQFGSTGSGDAFLTDARGLAATSDGTIVVADEWAFALKEYDYTGTHATFARKLFGGGPPLPGVNSPRGMDVDPTTGALFAVDWWNQRIEKFSAAGNLVTAWGHRGTKAEPGSINFAWDVAVNPANGNVYVANRESHEIEVFSPSGDYVTRWGFRGAANGKFVFPQGVAFDPTDGTLLVSDSGNNRIQRFRILASGKGSWVASYGSAGTAPGQFATPTGIDVAADGTIWVADTQNDRIQKRNPSTGAWTAYAAATGDATSFKSPWGVSVAPGGEIWVSDTSQDRLVRMTSSGALNSTVDAASLGIATMDAPFTVEFGTAGQIYVSVVWDNRILHLDET